MRREVIDKKRSVMSIFKALVKKETLHVVRDTRTMLIIFLIPIVLLLLFGFAISTEVNSVRVMVVSENHTDVTRQAVEQLRTNPYFDFQGMVSPIDADLQLRRGATDAVVFLRAEQGGVKSQIVVDASNTTVAQASTMYIQNALAGKTESPAVINTLYNPQLKSAYNFVPGIMGMIFILICAIMTSVSIVGEKENGTMNLLLVSPVRPYSIILGKLVPYFILSFAILSVILLLGYTVLGLPASWSILNVIWVSVLYIILSLSIGLLVSTLVDTQLAALLVSAVIFMLPVIMLSGMLFPIDNMPVILQYISAIVPARWYISAMRKLMVQHLPIQYVAQEVAVLAGMLVVIIVMAIKKFTKR